MTEFLQSPEFLNVLGTIITAAISVGAWFITRYTGIKIEAQHREALHEAIISGVASAQRYGAAEGMQTLKAHVYAHLRRSVPDALKALAPGDTVLDTLIERYAQQAIDRISGQR